MRKRNCKGNCCLSVSLLTPSAAIIIITTIIIIDGHKLSDVTFYIHVISS